MICKFEKVIDLQGSISGKGYFGLFRKSVQFGWVSICQGFVFKVAPLNIVSALFVFLIILIAHFILVFREI